MRFRPARTTNGEPMQPTRLPRKKDVVIELLEHATVFVHLDPRAEAVRVPPWFKRQPQLVLQIGLNMQVPIPDLEVDDEGLSCTLSFNRSPFLCVIPWSSVFALVDDRRQGMVWPDDVPPELKVAPAPEAAPAAALPAAKEVETEEKAPAPKRRARKTAAAKTERTTATKPVRAAAKGRASAKPQAAPKRATAEKAALPKAVPAAAPAPAAAAGGASKRKLPPYLRVVK